MNTQILASAALIAIAAVSTPAAAASWQSAEGEAAAVEACKGFNDYGPAELVTVVDDGMGDFLVWLEDVDGDLWACNASAGGDIYANALVIDDLLGGEGVEMVHLVGGSPSRNPAKPAENLCVALTGEPARVVASVEDGLGDWLVWLTVDDGETFVMCNASSDGVLYAFEDVSLPINDLPVVETAPAFEDTPARPAVASPSRPGQFS